MSPFFAQLRQKVGHDLLLLPSVTILVVDAADRVLLVRHAATDVWVAPGGIIEVDEQPEVAARREMQEETGYQVELTGILGVYGGPEFRITYPNQDQVAYVMTVYQARVVAGELKPDGQETLEAAFFSYPETLALPTGMWLPVVLKDVFTRTRSLLSPPSMS